MRNGTRQQLIDRLISDREARVAAEAERYKDKQMDEPRPSVMAVVKYGIGVRVLLRLDAERQAGYVTAVTIRQSGVHYGVSWGDSRQETYHSDFELEEADGDGGGSSSHAAY